MINLKRMLISFFLVALIIILSWLFLSRAMPTFLSRTGWFFLLALITLLIIRGRHISDKSTKGWLGLAIIGCVAITLTYSSLFRNRIEKSAIQKSQGQKVPITQERSWSKRVKFDPRNAEGMFVVIPEAGYYNITHLGNAIYDKPEYALEGRYYEIWGTEYAPGAEKNFVYPNEKCVAVLIIADGIAGDSNVHRFAAGQRAIRAYATKGFTIFLNDCVWENNSGSLTFEIKKAST